MTFRNENAVTTAVKAAKRNRVRLAVLGGAVAVLPVAGLVTATTASAASASTWDAVAQCESTGNWGINSGNGFSGGLQFTPSTWAAYGGTQYAGSAAQATQAQQIAVAEKVLADQGPGAWPVCSVKAGLTAGGAPAQVDTGSSSAPVKQAPAQQAPAAPAPAQQSAPAKQSAPAEQSPKQAPAQRTAAGYTVKSGDTLSAIAAAHGTTVHKLYAHNAQTIGANPDVILPGQVLSI
ncbi:LysM peptidoglycan-binding domain-containing protein [Kitasatospora kifunensis]|uniref:LysM repeat protein n=1 Tax=Kitasatospora kifunensis TaxID=58351 RepID=A0A7W7VXZ0_KITKI|nr:transglycosylase family protein [Kitasatospora kifunensis]MBB4927162.1 LysM repeat protein [Kitasatospora kifunensis]